MNRKLSGGAALAMGAACYLGGDLLTESYNYSPEEYNRMVISCAETLGSAAVDTAVLSPACQQLETAFSRTTQQTTQYDPATMVGSTQVRTTTYHLPPAEKFREDHTITPEEDQKREDARQKMLLVTAGLGSVMYYGTLRMMDRQTIRSSKQ